MPSLEATESSMPRSALRYRPREKDANQQGSHPRALAGITPVVKRASRLHPTDTEEDEVAGAWEHVEDEDGAAARGHTQARPGVSQTPPRMPRLIRRGRKRHGMQRGHPLLYLGIGMLGMLALWMVGTAALNWWNIT